MKRNFVTVGRAIIAYMIGIATGAIAFIPWLDVINTRGNEPPQLDHSVLQQLVYWSRVELGAVLIAFMVPAVLLVPFYAVAMVFARWRQISCWLYYVALGITLAAVLCLLPSGISRAPAPLHGEWLARLILVLAAPIGTLGGAACWLFLRLTR